MRLIVTLTIDVDEASWELAYSDTPTAAQLISDVEHTGELVQNFYDQSGVTATVTQEVRIA